MERTHQAGVVIEADGWYTVGDLVFLGVSEDTQKAARASGQLPFLAVGPDAFLHLGADVESWLKRGAPTVAPPAGPKGPQRPKAMADFDSLVCSKMAGGLSRSDACIAAAKADPRLHERFVTLSASAAEAKRRRCLGRPSRV